MNYETMLQVYLLSEKNIDYLVNNIITNYKISNKAINKCRNIISDYLNKYLHNLNRYPQNNDELVEAIDFLNKKCYEDFVVYLSTRYPNMNLLRTPPPKEMPTKEMATKEMATKKVNEIIILTEEEKNKLLKQYTPNPVATDPVNTDFLSYLTNPVVLQMFTTMINQVNQPPPPKKFVIDAILDKNQVNELMTKMRPVDTNQATPVKLAEPIKTNQATPVKLAEPIKTNQATPVKLAEAVKPPIESEIDFTTDLTTDKLPLIEARINQLMTLKTKYLNEKNMDKVKEMDDEKSKIITAVNNFKSKLEQEAKETESKIDNITRSNVRKSEEANVEYLDLKFDPTGDYTNLKNIIIKFTTTDKIKDITLVDYFLPFNNNNVTRFNNKFVVYFNNRVTKITIPPGKYEIDSLLAYIKNQVTFLEFTIHDNIITIKNTMDMKFELMVDTDTIFPLLGFNGKVSSYKDEKSYSANVAYNINCNEKVRFILSGSSVDPLPLEFNKLVTLNKSLKKASMGLTMKQIVLNFMNELEQHYDFTEEFMMCFKITYVKEGVAN